MISNLILPKISSKIKIVKTDLELGKVVETIEGSNTIRRDALCRMTGIGKNEHDGTKILAGLHDNNYVEDLSFMNLSLLKSSRFNERTHETMTFASLTTNTIPSYAQKINRIVWNGRDLLPTVDFDFIFPSQIIWLKDPESEDYPCPGQTAEIYYCPSFFDCSIDENLDFHVTGAINQYELFKDGNYVWRFDIRKNFAAPETAREIFGISFYHKSVSNRATLSHLEISQNVSEILDIYYSIYLDYSQAVSSSSGLVSSEPRKARMLEYLIRDMFFYNNSYKSFGSVDYNNSGFKRFRNGYMYKPLLSYNYFGNNSELFMEHQRWGHYLDTDSKFGFKDVSDIFSYTYDGGNKIIASQEFAYRGSYFVAGQPWSHVSIANLVDKHNALSRSFLHSGNFTYDPALNKMAHLTYPTYESSDVYINSYGFIELIKTHDYDGETIEQSPFDIMPWVYILKFTASGNENNAECLLYKSPMIYIENTPDHGTAGLYFLSRQAIWNNYDAFKPGFANYYVNDSVEMYNKQVLEYTVDYGPYSPAYTYYAGFLYDPATSSYGFSTLRSEFSDVDENGYYGLAVGDNEFQIRNVNYTGMISSFSLLNREKLAEYKNTNEILPSDKTQIFSSDIEFRGALILMSAQDNESPPVVTIQRRRSAIFEEFTTVTNQTITDLSGNIGTDFTYTKYHWSNIIKWDTNVGGNQWRVQGLSNGSIYFLTAADIAMLEQNNGDGKDVLEYANRCYGTILGKKGNYVYFATVNGMLKAQIPSCFGQKEIDELDLTTEYFCPYNNFNLDPASHTLSLIFPHQTDGKIYMLYSNGTLWLFDEETEVISSVNTSVAPWTGINLTPETVMTKYFDKQYIQSNDYKYWPFYWSHNRFVYPKTKCAAWLNEDGDIITFVRGTIKKITNPGGIDYIDFNFDDHNQKYLVAMINTHQTVLDPTDNNLKSYQVKYDVFDLGTSTRIITNQWVDVTMSFLGGVRTSANIFYDSTNNKHHIISSLGSGLIKKQGTVRVSGPTIPNYDYAFNNSESLSLPTCEDAGVPSSVSLLKKQLCGFMKWFTLNEEDFSMWSNQKFIQFGVTPEVKQYGYNDGTFQWVLNRPNSQKCSSDFQNLIDNVRIRFGIQPGESSASFVKDESLSFIRYKNGIFKDNLQNISNLRSAIYAGKINRIQEDEVFLIDKKTGNGPSDYAYFETDKESPSLWFLQVIKEDSDFEARVIPAYNYDFSLDGFTYSNDWKNFNSYDNELSNPIGADLIQVRLYDEGSWVKCRIWIKDETNVPYSKICEIFGELKTVRCSCYNPGYVEYGTVYNGGQMVMEYDYDTSTGVTNATYMVDIPLIRNGAVTPACLNHNITLELDDNMRTFSLIPTSASRVPYSDINTFTATGSTITLGPSELYIYDKNYLGLMNNKVFVVDENQTDIYTSNNKLKFENADGVFSSFYVMSSCYNTPLDRTYVTVNTAILLESQCPTHSFWSDTNTSSYFCGLSAIPPSAGPHCTEFAKFLHFDTHDDWEYQVDYGGVQLEYEGHYDEDRYIIDLQYDANDNKTTIQVDSNVTFILLGDFTTEYPVLTSVDIDLVSKFYRTAFPLTGTVQSSLFDGTHTTITLLQDSFEIDEWVLQLFAIEENVLFRFKGEITTEDVTVVSAGYNQSLDKTVISISETISDTPSNVILAKRWYPQIRNLNEAYFNFYFYDYEIRTLSKSTSISLGPAGEVTVTLEKDALIIYSYTKPTWMGYVDLTNNTGYRLTSTEISGAPSNMENYHVEELSNKIQLHRNHYGSILLPRQIYYTSFV